MLLLLLLRRRLLLLLLLLGSSGAGAPIDRRAVVARHDIRFRNPKPDTSFDFFCDPNATSSAFSQLTLGNGDFAATVDLTGLQSLNASYGSSSDFGFPALTQASWGWHTPDPRRIDPTMPSPWRADGSLNITYEDFPVVSLDERPGHGNRTIPILLNCQKHNDPRLCSWWVRTLTAPFHRVPRL
jgi:hypothetical protein